MTREEEKNKARFKYVSERLAIPDFPTYNAEYELEAAFNKGAEWADAHPHWISVKDRKPKLKHKNDYYQYSEVVIVTDGEYCTSASWVHSLQAGWCAWYNGDEELKGVTHWMPLPSVEHFRETTKMIEKGGEK